MKLTSFQKRLYPKLSTPGKVQDFLGSLRINFKDTCYSPAKVLERQNAQCMEGAMLAASILRFHGHKPLVLDLRAHQKDFDHVVTLFKYKSYWGAISKTNHAVLRFRDPIYKNIRELAMSYFHEYFMDNGTKTLIDYSKPFNLANLDIIEWETSDKMLWQIPEALDESPHINFINKYQQKILRKADPLEIKAGKLVEWKKTKQN